MKEKAASKSGYVSLTVRSVLSVIFGICLIISLLPIAVHIINIGVYVTVGGFAAALAITVFWKQFSAAVRRAFSVRGLRWITGAVFAAVGLLIIGAAIISVMMLAAMNNASSEPDQTVIVLGCQVRGESPSRMLRSRLDRAQQYLSENPGSICIVSGSKGTNESVTEAYAMKKYLVERGISAERIIEEDRSTNTSENLRFSKEIMDGMKLPPKAVIITDGFHQWRAQRFARDVGLDATGLGSRPVWGLEMCFWVREIFAVARVILLGY
ncbi:MAG: YdcF family protein [Clostridia bacterium]|nr:YdcF family protein [Clostridia bacterium]